ncbi:hypothetical protein MRB53_033194 [Persea americana]|uniref:Uncharacterized protein n=1 Tax=Persea americana TaxID=3435 RepID=A0ACC2KU03_PERAE|nr:hypothetical protein MRB53_033194 [Persea americana]
MPPKRKLYVKPGALTKEKNSYGPNRNSSIQRKIPRLNELGAHTLEQALEGPTRRRVTPEDEDDDFNMEYRPSRSEEELSSSGEDDLEDEFANMVGQGRQRHRSAVSQVQRAASQHTIPEHAVSQSTVPERAASQSTVPERAASQSTEISARARTVTDPDLSIAHSMDSSVASTSRRVRGKVVGSAAEKRMKALGVKMIVPLGEMSGAFEGVNASTFAVELGSHIRRIAPYDKPTWSVVDDGTREAVYMAASQKFDFGDWKTDQPVKVAVHKLAMHIYREFRSELHKKYKQLLGEGCDPKQYPPDPQRAAQWISMIEHKWETPEWKVFHSKTTFSDQDLADPSYVKVGSFWIGYSPDWFWISLCWLRALRD